jgi:hypothetical protein
MNDKVRALLSALALSMLANAAWDGFKLLTRAGWSRRQVAFAWGRDLAWPATQLQVKRVVSGLIVTLVLAAIANTLPLAVLPEQ